VNPEFQSQIHEKVLRDPDFVHAVFSGHRPQTTPQWIKVTIKPVLLKQETRLQFQYFDPLKSITRNYGYAEAAQKLDEALALPFRHYYVRSLERGFQVQVTKRGKILVREHANREGPAPRTLAHDRQKKRPLDPARPDRILSAVGIMTADGRIKPTMQSKFRQINEFLRLVGSRIAPSTSDPNPVRVVDFGCGNAYLTFALYDYLVQSTSCQPSVTGVDSDALAIERHRVTCADLSLGGLSFEIGDIAGYEAHPPPEVVVALHACDTATDEALAKAIRWRAKHVFCVPCCHHHLQAQMDARRTAASILPILRFGVLKERLGDIVTDALRAFILGMLGYHVDMVQFVSPEHTAKNLMLIASSRESTPAANAVSHYKALRGSLDVVPYLETLLADELLPILGNG
jgi:hypothetical protein